MCLVVPEFREKLMIIDPEKARNRILLADVAMMKQFRMRKWEMRKIHPKEQNIFLIRKKQIKTIHKMQKQTIVTLLAFQINTTTVNLCGNYQQFKIKFTNLLFKYFPRSANVVCFRLLC